MSHTDHRDKTSETPPHVSPFRAHWYVAPIFVLLVVLAILFGGRWISPTSDEVPQRVGFLDLDPPPLEAKGPWPMFRGNPAATGVASSPLAEELTLFWRQDLGSAITSTAAIVDGRVYVGTNGHGVFALDLRSGRRLWTHPLEAAVSASPCVKNGRVFVGDGDGVVHAIDAASGEGLWTFAAEGEIASSPVVVGDDLLVASYDGKLYCLAAATGEERWTSDMEQEINPTPSVGDGGVLIAGCRSGLVRLVELATGSKTFEIEIEGAILGSPARSGHLAVVPTYGGKVVCLDLAEGRTAWEFKAEQAGVSFHASPAVVGQRVIVAGGDNLLRCLRLADGKELWQFAAKGDIRSSPVVAGSRVYVGSHDGNLYVVDLDSGRKLWHFAAGEPFTASPAVGYGRLVIGNENGLLYCFGPKPRPGEGI